MVDHYKIGIVGFNRIFHVFQLTKWFGCSANHSHLYNWYLHVSQRCDSERKAVKYQHHQNDVAFKSISTSLKLLYNIICFNNNFLECQFCRCIHWNWQTITTNHNQVVRGNSNSKSKLLKLNDNHLNRRCDKISIINPILERERKNSSCIPLNVNSFCVFTPLKQNATQMVENKGDRNQRCYSLSANCSHIILNKGKNEWRIIRSIIHTLFFGNSMTW